MIAELGHALLWMASVLALLQIVSGVRELRGGATVLRARPLAVAQGALTLAAFALLIWLFGITDLSVDLVARNSALDKPLIYKLTGAWGNHEGSMLLWLAILSLSGMSVALFERRLDRPTLTATLTAQAALSLGFYAFLLLVSNPFARLFPSPAQGEGLNPLLQDPGLAFHPPTLYLGYVGLSVAFSFAVGALVTGVIGPAFARAMRPWVLGSWIFLTLGIVAGSYWAYYTLGWGGWWFWDPVENASLMPWLAATALLHSVSVTATRDALRAWTLMLAVIAFSMSMIGTFIVRSGLLTSVHSFAVDPERGTFILALLILYIGAALALFGWRAGAVREGKLFALWSREGGIVVNNLLLTAILFIVLVGTLYPIVAEALGSRISVGPPYFNVAAGVPALIMVAVLMVGPLLRWRKDRPERARRWLPLMLGATLVAGGAAWALIPNIRLLPLAGLSLAAPLALLSLAPLAGRKLSRAPLTLWGMVIAHLGVAVALAGMASESALTSERLASLRVGETSSVAGWQVKLDDVRPRAGENFTALEAVVRLRRGSDEVVLRPQSRNFVRPEMQTSVAALATRVDGQLYAVLGGGLEDGRWPLRLWWKPFVWAIWFGGGMIALGGALALIGRLQPLRAWRARRRQKPRVGPYARRYA